MPCENPESPSPSLTPAQVAAIRKAKESSRIICDYLPEVAQDFRIGMSHPAIANKHHLDRMLNIGMRQAIMALRFALTDLIRDRTERFNLARAHMRQNGLGSKTQKKGIHGLNPEQMTANGKKGATIAVHNKLGIHGLTSSNIQHNARLGGEAAMAQRKGVFSLSKETLSTIGKQNRDNKIGIFSLSTEQRIAYGKRGGDSNTLHKTGFCSLSREERSAIGKKNYESGIGIANLSPEQRKSNSKKARFTITERTLLRLRQGQPINPKYFPWNVIKDPETDLTEGDYCDRLIRDTQYHRIRQGRIQILCTQIAQHLNNKFHGGTKVRTKKSIIHRINNYRVSIDGR